MSTLDDAIAIQNDIYTVYDKVAYRAIISRLIQLIATERRRHNEEIKLMASEQQQ